MTKKEREARKAIGGVVKALADYMLWHSIMAENSYTRFSDGEPVWNRDVWRASNPEGLKLYERARRAIDRLSR